jgi:predicted DNA-binding transcriptional regulator AlpA
MKSERRSKPQHLGGGGRVAQKLVSAVVPRRFLYRVEEAAVLLGLSRSQLYEVIRSGRGAPQFAPHVSNGPAAVVAGLS